MRIINYSKVKGLKISNYIVVPRNKGTESERERGGVTLHINSPTDKEGETKLFSQKCKTLASIKER